MKLILNKTLPASLVIGFISILILLVVVAILVCSLGRESVNADSQLTKNNCLYSNSVKDIVGLTYDAARVKIISAGWKPEHPAEPPFCSKYGGCNGLLDKGYYEVQNCASTGLGPCSLLFKDECRNSLHVVTDGEYPYVSSFSVTAGNR